MRLIVEYVDSDECTYSCTVTVPVNADSKEQLYVDLCDIADRYSADNKARVEAWDAFSKKYASLAYNKNAALQMQYYSEREELSGKFPHWEPTYTSGESVIYLERCFSRDGVYYPPNIYTVDEWFEMNGLE